ncbi:MAG: Histidine biosynthesis bifunctional protein (HisIE) [Leptospirillum sp. Group IV 'UBA BS']|nr:MAG: Histidine biosynthesis bifunctional protein (HisIE) [Leptospirillum sp. Group IV 'UBA BS']
MIRARRGESPDTSYVARLIAGPRSALLKKLVEEAGEILAAVYEENPAAIRSEMADLVFHLLVTLERTGLSWEAVMEELEKRTGKGGLAEKRERQKTTPTP